MKLLEITETPKFDTSQTFYRGSSNQEHDATSHRSDYAVFVSTNIHQAASYAGPNGHITSMTLNPSNIIEVKGGMFFSPTNFDDQAINLQKGQALVAHKVVDSGGFAHKLPNNLYTYSATNVAFKDPSIATVGNTIPANSYFEQT